MANLNICVLAGRMVSDPQKVDTKVLIVKFPIAVNRFYTKDGETKEETDFFDVVLFGQRAEYALQYGSKGREVIVEGSLRQEKWQDKSGDNRSKVTINGE